MNAFSCIQLPSRDIKPRKNGLTMVIDKNLSPAKLEDLLEQCGNSIDLMKLGWGTSVVQDEKNIRSKLDTLRKHSILAMPGGTLTELAWHQGVIDNYFTEAAKLGFSCIEVSDGTVNMPHQEKCKLIQKAKCHNFEVVSEVGSKDSAKDLEMPIAQRIEQIELELAAGSFKVIIEARESGTVGIFGKDKNTREDLLASLVSAIDVNNLIFEAPHSSQQASLIMEFGNNVNLGNIPPEEIVSLETYRLGLRSDTLLHFHLNATNYSN